MNFSKIIDRITSFSLLKTAGSITCGFFLSIHSHANDSDFAKYENTISMTCFPDSGEITQWSYNGELFFMDGLPFEIDGEFIKKKSGKNVFLMKTAFAEFYVDFDNKKQVASTFGMKFESGCF